MPSTYYTFTQQLADGSSVQFVMVDTETLFGGVNTPPPAQPAAKRRRLSQSSTDDPGASSPRDPPVPSSWVPPAVDEAQWAWVAATLNASRADWLIVVGHHPVWSAGEYGPTWILVERLLPLMEAAGVALYICGHEHQMEHFRAEPHPSSVDFLVVGNGAYWNDTAPADASHAADCPAGALQFQYTTGTGFAALWLQPASSTAPSHLSATLYGSAAQTLYSFYKENPRGGAAGGTAGAKNGAAQRDVRDLSAALLLVVGVATGLLLAARLAQAQVADVARVRGGGPRDLVAERISVWEKGRAGTERAPLMRAQQAGAVPPARSRKTADAL